MKIFRRAACVAIMAVAIASSGVALAQTSAFYAGKTLTVLVGVQAGGTADTVVRRFTEHMRKYIPGSPNIIVQNMTGAGSNLVFNYFAEKAAGDGLTIVFSSYQALAQALGDQSLRARFEDFEYLGGVSDTRVSYMRSDAVAGGIKSPADIMKANNLIVGSYSNTDFEGTLSNLSLDVLGVQHRMVVGYRGGSDIFLAMQRNEVQLHNTSLGTYRTRSAAFIKSGEGVGVFYLASVDPDGTIRKNEAVTEMPSFPELYKQVHRKPPSGVQWDALNWLVSQTSELAYAALAPRGTPAEALGILRKALSETAVDPQFIEQSVKLNGLPYNFVPVDRGNAIVRSLASASPALIDALRASMNR